LTVKAPEYERLGLDTALPELFYTVWAGSGQGLGRIQAEWRKGVDKFLADFGLGIGC